MQFPTRHHWVSIVRMPSLDDEAEHYALLVRDKAVFHLKEPGFVCSPDSEYVVVCNETRPIVLQIREDASVTKRYHHCGKPRSPAPG